MRPVRRRKAPMPPPAPTPEPQGPPGRDAQDWCAYYARRADAAYPPGLPPTGGLLAASRTRSWREGRFTITDP